PRGRPTSRSARPDDEATGCRSPGTLLSRVLLLARHRSRGRLPDGERNLRDPSSGIPARLNVKALVTGAGGFCGTHLSRHLARQSVEVHTLSLRAGAGAHHMVDLSDPS